MQSRERYATCLQNLILFHIMCDYLQKNKISYKIKSVTIKKLATLTVTAIESAMLQTLL